MESLLPPLLSCLTSSVRQSVSFRPLLLLTLSLSRLAPHHRSFGRYVTEGSVALETAHFREYAFSAESMKRFAAFYGFDLDAFWTDVCALVVLGIVARVIVARALVTVNRPKRATVARRT